MKEVQLPVDLCFKTDCCLCIICAARSAEWLSAARSPFIVREYLLSFLTQQPCISSHSAKYLIHTYLALNFSHPN